MNASTMTKAIRLLCDGRTDEAKALVDSSFSVIDADDGRKNEMFTCFRCDGRWYPIDKYILHPSIECWVPEKYVKGVS